MGHSRAWTGQEAVPDDNDQISAGAGGIRNHMVDVRERMAFDHIWASSTATDGYHTTIHLQGRGDNPTAVASYALLFAKTGAAGAVELYLTGSGSQLTQLTSAGYLYLGNARVPNNSYILATNSAGTGTINVWKVDGSNLIVAGTSLSSITIVPPLVMTTTGVNTDLNAAYLNYYLASTSATASTIMVSDTAGRCSPYLKTYDSGWFAVAANTAYAKTHNLGTTAFIYSVYGAADGSGTRAGTIGGSVRENAGQYQGVVIDTITTTTCNIRAGTNNLGGYIRNAAANGWELPTYVRVIMLALE